MAKIKGPLMSSAAHGKIAQSLLYRRRSRQNTVDKLTRPTGKPSLSQLTQRTIIGLLTAHWQCMSSGDKQTYKDLGKLQKPPLPGFNYFIRVAQTDLKTHHGLLGAWFLNEATGTTCYDSSGQGNNGVIATVSGSPSAHRTSSLSDKFGRAVRLYEGHQHVKINHNDNLNIVNAISVEILIKPLDLSVRGGLVTKSYYGDPMWALMKFNDGELWWYIRKGGDADNEHCSIELEEGKWNLAMITHTNYDINWYINRKHDTDTADLKPELSNGSEDLYIGDGPTSSPGTSPCIIDRVLIYNRILSQAEYNKHYMLLRNKAKRQYNLV
jgi:hypothetical protein